MYREYKNDIEFVIVYIREAHPELLREGNATGIVGRPDNLDERIILATECVSQFEFTIPMVIDGMQGTINADYDAAPVRVTITDRDGKVAYYAGRGPFDFRLSKVEKVLKKLVAHGGRVPPAPPVSWGEPSDGLRLGLSFDPPHPAPGDDVAVILAFENVLDKPLYLYYQSADPFQNLTVQGPGGRSLALESTGVDPLASMRSRGDGRRGGGGHRAGLGSFRIFPQKIAAGETLRTDIEGRIPKTQDADHLGHGAYQARFAFEVTDLMIQPIRRFRDLPFWKGRVISGEFGISVVEHEAQSCMSCHGVKNYHHASELACDLCHTGAEGTPEFAVNNDACSTCHPREKARGRRLVAGAGRSSSYTVHTASIDDDGACLRCHDSSGHQQGAVVLVDPRTEHRGRWLQSVTEFCLFCHGPTPPAEMSFPQSDGKDYDKSAFRTSKWHQQGMSCTGCHETHGSLYPSLLKKKNIPSPHK